MAKYQTLYSNNARTTLASPITATSTTFSVMSAAGFPTISDAIQSFYVTLDDGVNVEIVKVTGVTGSTLTGCVRGQEGTLAAAFAVNAKVENRLTAGNITEFARLSDRLIEVATVALVPTPATTNSNSVLCTEKDAGGNPIVFFREGVDPVWNSPNFAVPLASGTVGASTTTSIVFAGAAAKLPLTTPRAYLVRILTGVNQGLVRIVTSLSADALNVASFPAAFSSIDWFELRQCTSTSLMPVGGGTDRVFFENSQSVYTNYTLTAGKNAISAGPVTIQSGVTVTVPLGARWAVV